MKTYIKRPVLMFLIFNILGALSQYFGNVYIGFFLMVLSIILILKFFDCKNVFFIICILSFFVGLNSMIFNENKIAVINNYANDDVTITGKIVEVANNKKVYVKTHTSNNKFLENKKIVITGDVQNYTLGDTLNVKGQIKLFQHKNNFAGFDEYLYEKSKNAICKIDNGTIKVEEKSSNYIHHLINQNINSNINFENREVIRTMILGIDKELSNDLKESYRTAGIYHILAISGLHIGIIYSFLVWIFKRVNFLKNKTYIIILLLFYYCYITGNSISTLRAVFMCSLLILSEYVNRKYDILNALYFVAFVLITYNPFLLFSVGFIYSFACVFGISIFREDISLILSRVLQCNEKIYEKFAKKSFIDAVAVTLSVTLVIIPINIYYFNTFNIFSIIINILIVPFISILVLSSFFVSIFGAIKIIVIIFSPIITVIFYIFNFILSLFNSLTFGKLLIATPNIYNVVMYYMLLYFTINYILNKNKLYKKTIITIATLFLILNVRVKSDSIVFLSDDYSKQLNVVVQSGNKTILISNNNNGNMYLFNNYLDYIGVRKADVYININRSFLSNNVYTDEIRAKTLILPLNTVENDDKISYNELYEILEQKNMDLKLMKNKDKIILGDINIEMYEYENQIYLLNLNVGNYNFNLINNNSYEIEQGKMYKINYGNNSTNFNATINVNSENYIGDEKNYNLLKNGDIKFIIDKELKIKTLR